MWVSTRSDADPSCVIPPAVAVRRLEVVDDAGRTVGTLAADASGVRLTFADPAGSSFATLSAGPARAELSVFAGGEAASLSAGSDLGGLVVSVPHPERAIVVSRPQR
jgi:hypothetical protein